MKTNEFIKKAQELGYIASVWNLTLSLYEKGYPGFPLLELKTDKRFSLKMHPGNFVLSANYEEDCEKLYDLAAEYDKTPIEEREEKKKYYLRLSGADIPAWNSYLNKLCNAEFFFSDGGENNNVKTKFTDEEISEFPTWVNNMLRDGYLIKEGVKDENK